MHDATCIVSAMSKTDADLALESRLCLACGICCDGTLYPFALIGESEVEETAGIGLKTMRTTDGIPAFLLACRYLDGAACTRYQEWRPSVCGDFFCHVQKRARKEQITEDDAFTIIAQARKLIDDVKSLLPAGLPIAKARDEFKRLAAKQPDLTPEEARFVVKMFVLERFLDAEFRGPKRRHLPTDSTASARN